jgi:hypothetical protein
MLPDLLVHLHRVFSGLINGEYAPSMFFVVLEFALKSGAILGD